MNVETYENLYPSLFGYAYSLTKNRSDAEDLVSETVLQCIQSNAEPDNIKAWCIRVLKNKFLSSKRKKTEELIEQDDPYYNKLKQEEDVTAEIQFNDCFELLSTQFQQVLSLTVMQGIKAEQVATIIEKPLGTVLTWMTKSKKQLHDCISKK